MLKHISCVRKRPGVGAPKAKPGDGSWELEVGEEFKQPGVGRWKLGKSLNSRELGDGSWKLGKTLKSKSSIYYLPSTNFPFKQPGVGRWKLEVGEEFKQQGPLFLILPYLPSTNSYLPFSLFPSQRPDHQERVIFRFWVDCISPLNSLPVWTTSSLIQAV